MKDYAEISFGLIVLGLSWIPFFIGWIRKALKGIWKLPDIAILTHSRFTLISGLTTYKKEKYSFERLVSVPTSQLESKVWDILIMQQINIFGEGIELYLLQSSKSLKKEKAIFGEHVIGVKKAKQILNSNRA